MEVPLIIGGDFNASPGEVAGWLEDHPELEVVSCGAPTCHGGVGSSELDFFIIGRSLLHLFGGVELRASAVATHAAVTVDFATRGAEQLVEWVRPKVPELARKFGPQLQVSGTAGAALLSRLGRADAVHAALHNDALPICSYHSW